MHKDELMFKSRPNCGYEHVRCKQVPLAEMIKRIQIWQGNPGWGPAETTRKLEVLKSTMLVRAQRLIKYYKPEEEDGLKQEDVEEATLQAENDCGSANNDKTQREESQADPQRPDHYDRGWIIWGELPLILSSFENSMAERDTMVLFRL
ncbi:unnamed protein product [Phytophthora fragariaefolia]|uniref:Unnamed protein product n=1 Tax=Phytophthora fragariaefolia TaxID=1490495 RepID=A0A9W6WUS1_9STRA|nr:unnamed protein product [Phytophthora fragariaefolia]